MSDLNYNTQKVIDKGREPLGNTSIKYSKISKWQLLRMVQEILEGFDYAVLNCQKQIGQVQVKRGNEGSFIGGIISCDSVWLCPVCNLKKSAQRGNLIRQTDNNGFYQVMLTLTLQHDISDSLGDLLSALKDASSELKQGGFWQRIKKEFKIKAYITSTEITFGLNGWHPHIHMILYFDGIPDIDILWEKLVQRWIHVCGKVGRYASRFHSLNLTRSSGDRSADYMTKFRGGLSYEMTGQFNKSSGKGLTFWDLVRRRDRKKVIEYAESTFGLKSMTWSHNAKSILGIEEENLNDDDEIEVLADIPDKVWNLIRSKALQGVVLELAELDQGKLKEYLDILESNLNNNG